MVVDGRDNLPVNRKIVGRFRDEKLLLAVRQLAQVGV
jgi:hypothetical protein